MMDSLDGRDVWFWVKWWWTLFIFHGTGQDRTDWPTPFRHLDNLAPRRAYLLPHSTPAAISARGHGRQNHYTHCIPRTLFKLLPAAASSRARDAHKFYYLRMRVTRGDIFKRARARAWFLPLLCLFLRAYHQLVRCWARARDARRAYAHARCAPFRLRYAA